MNNYKEIYSLNEEVQDLDVRGPNDSFINAIESCLKIEIVIDDRKVFLKEEDLVYEKRVCNIFEAMETLLINNIVLNLSDVHALINNIDDNNVKSIVSLYLKKDVLITNVYGKPIYPKTLNQKLYIKSLEDNE